MTSQAFSTFPNYQIQSLMTIETGCDNTSYQYKG